MEEKKKRSFVVIGGGYYGLLSTLILSKNKNNTVHLVEKSNVLGGLYRSAWDFEGHHFDFGSRFIIGTGIEILDDELFGLLDDTLYFKTTDSLKEYSFQKGSKREYTNCLDARLLQKKYYESGLREFMNIKENSFKSNNYDNLSDYSKAMYGVTYSSLLIKPAFEKTANIKMENAHNDALKTFGLNRVIVSEGLEAIRLKSSSNFEESRVAYSTHSDHKSNLLKAYPKNGGMDAFSNLVSRHLYSKNNVHIYSGNEVAEFNVIEGNVETVHLIDGTKIGCDTLVCAVPPMKLAKLLNVDLSNFSFSKPSDIILVHFVVKGGIETSAYFHYNYDNEYYSFRSTFTIIFQIGHTIEIMLQLKSEKTLLRCQKNLVR